MCKNMKSDNISLNIDKIRSLVKTVRNLCEKGNLEAANKLYSSQLTQDDTGNCGLNVFRDAPALSEGRDCIKAFIGSDDFKKSVKDQLGLPVFGAFINKMGFYEHLLGNLSEAKKCYLKSIEIEKCQDNIPGNIAALHELSLVECAMGNIEESNNIIAKAGSLPHNDKGISLMNEYSYKAYYNFLSGDLDSALVNFGKSLFFENRDKEIHIESTYGLAGIQCAEFFLRTKSLEAFKKVNAFNIGFCKKKGWPLYLGMCHIMQGWYEISCNLLKEADKSLLLADQIIRPSGSLEQICRLDILWARLYGIRKEYGEGVDKINKTLLTIVENGFHLLEADALILRANINLMKYKLDIVPNDNLLEKVGKDGYSALKIANTSRYVWAKVESLELLSLYYKIKSPPQQDPNIKEEEKCRQYEKEAIEMRRKLVISFKSVKKLRSLEALQG